MKAIKLKGESHINRWVTKLSANDVDIRVGTAINGRPCQALPFPNQLGQVTKYWQVIEKAMTCTAVTEQRLLTH